MQLPGMLVEYLINGSVALLWLLPILQLIGIHLPDNPNTSIIVLLLPGLYVLGMLVDFIGWTLLRYPKLKLKNQVYSKLTQKLPEHSLENQITINAPELATVAERRNSLHRIARGSFVNSLISSISLPIYFSKSNSSLVMGSVIAGITITLIFFFMWLWFQWLSYDFQVNVVNHLDEKLRKDRRAKKS